MTHMWGAHGDKYGAQYTAIHTSVFTVIPLDYNAVNTENGMVVRFSFPSYQGTGALTIYHRLLFRVHKEERLFGPLVFKILYPPLLIFFFVSHRLPCMNFVLAPPKLNKKINVCRHNLNTCMKT